MTLLEHPCALTVASQSTSFVKQSKIRKKKRKSVYVHTGPINGTRDLIHADPPLEQCIAGRFLRVGVWFPQLPRFSALRQARDSGRRPPCLGRGRSAGTWGIRALAEHWLSPTRCWEKEGEGRKRVFSSLLVDSLLQAICYNNSQNKPQQTQTEITRAFSDIRAFNLCKYCTKQIKYCKLY